ncbi:MAG: thiazole biosynthesis protein [Candidatus Lokiarchaeota archaeon]|nr:thiazole biosynthesis protein [Candidatus Lokiarchaeota archaeon]
MPKLDEIIITKAITETYLKDLMDNLELDVVIAGAGPAGMCCAKYIAEKGHKVAIFERRLSIGGGIWGGGMMFNKVVVQDQAKKIIDDFEIKNQEYQKGYYVADAVEMATKMAAKVIDAGAKIFNLISIEDVMYRKDRITGVVINWSAVEMAKLHIDPMTVRARVVIDGTGHECSICRVVEEKMKLKLNTTTGRIEGERSMWADIGENILLETTKEVVPGLFVVGMAANAVSGGPRMGPIFGGMLLSGKKAADLIIKQLE